MAMTPDRHRVLWPPPTDARMMFATRHQEKVKAVRMEAKRVAANGGLVVVETRVEGELGGEVVSNHLTFHLEIVGDEIVRMYEYTTWTAKHAKSGWADIAFAREAWPTTLVPYVEATVWGASSSA